MAHAPHVIDPAGRGLHAEADLLRTRGCAALVELPGGIRAWAPTRYAVLKQLLADDRVSKDPNQHWPAWMNGEFRETWVNSWVGVTNMFTAYGSNHRRLRKLISPAFTKRRTDGLRPRVEELAAGLLDRMAESPDGRVDLRAAYAHPLPMQVICELFGLPEDRQADAARLIAGIMDTTVTPEQAMAVWQEVQELLGGLVALKRETPADDLTSVLIATRDEEDGSGLTEQELIDTLLLVIGAGHETTVNLIGNAVQALLSHPDQLARVLAGEIPWSDVIEETLRWPPRSPICRCGTPSRTSSCPTASRSPRVTRSSRRTPRRGATRSATATTRDPSTSRAWTRSTSPSGTASTSASVPRWPASKRRSRCPLCSSASPAWLST